MSFSGGNKKITDLFRPIKKNAPNTTTTITTLNNQKTLGKDQFISPKRRRRLQPEKQEELDKLFDKISDDPFYENIIPSLNNNDNSMERDDSLMDDTTNPIIVSADQQIEWLYDDDIHGESTTPTADDLANMADGFLEEELTEQFKQALNSTDLHDDGIIHYRFFSERCKLPNPSSQHENMELADKSTKMKYYHIIKYSQPEDERHFLLSSGQLQLWHRLGWQCPHSVLQWLIQVVAFEKNLDTARLAMSTVSSIWLDVLRNVPLGPLIMDGIDYDQKFSVDTFSSILTSYGALNLPTRTNEKDEDDMVMTENDITLDRIPLTQFEWVLDLLKTSLTLWPDVYTNSELHYIAKVLVYLGMDGIGALVLKHIQDALEACLSGLPGDDWKPQVQQLALTLCEQQQFTSMGLQVRLPTIAKPTSERCLYLRRMIALIALELALEKDQQQKTTTTNITPPSYQKKWQQNLSVVLTSDDILPRLVDIMNDDGSIFQQAEPQYRDYSDRICLLDYAIGNNYTEFMTFIDAIHSLVTQLQASSRKIGGRLGTLERTKANEVTQRLWSRLAYVISRNGNTVEDIEF